MNKPLREGRPRAVNNTATCPETLKPCERADCFGVCRGPLPADPRPSPTSESQGANDADS